MNSPHVVMLGTGPLPFGESWARAGKTAANVTLVGGKKDVSDEAAYPIVSSSMYRWRPSRIFRPLADRLEAERVRQVLLKIAKERGPIDLIHAHFYSGAEPARIVSHRLGIPYVVTEHSSAFLASYSDSRRGLTLPGRSRAKRIFQEAAAVIAVSEALRDGILSATGFSDIDVIGNPVDTARFSLSKRLIDRKSGSLQVSFVGRLSEEKDPVGVIEAFGRSGIDARLAVVGDGPLRSQVESARLRQPRPDRIEVLGHLGSDEVAKRLNDTDIFVCNSRIETFGIAVAEAMAAGCLVVYPEIPALRALVGNYGHPFDGRGNDELVSALRSAARRAPTYDPEPGSRYVEGAFSFEAVGRSLRDLWLRVLDQVKIRE